MLLGGSVHNSVKGIVTPGLLRGSETTDMSVVLSPTEVCLYPSVCAESIG
jgi:hypothetical protein